MLGTIYLDHLTTKDQRQKSTTLVWLWMNAQAPAMPRDLKLLLLGGIGADVVVQSGARMVCQR